MSMSIICEFASIPATIGGLADLVWEDTPAVS